jgi:hypothetical protein
METSCRGRLVYLLRSLTREEEKKKEATSEVEMAPRQTGKENKPGV